MVHFRLSRYDDNDTPVDFLNFMDDPVVSCDAKGDGAQMAPSRRRILLARYDHSPDNIIE